MRIYAQLTHMAQADVLAMVRPDVLARIKLADPTPEIRAYAIAHEGEAVGTIVGLGQRAIQYFRDAIIALYERLREGTPTFWRHNADNSHDGRDVVGELVGKSIMPINGVLHTIGAVYIRPEHRGRHLDIASIEANVELTDTGDGKRMRAVEVGDVTGIALSSSAVEKPGFPGATLLAAVQAFVQGEQQTMTLEELKAAIAAGKHRPSDVFGEDALKSDPFVVGHVKSEKQTEYEHAKRVETKLGEERATWQAKEAEAAKELEALKSQAIVGKSRDVLSEAVKAAKLDEKQSKFVERAFGNFKSEAKDEAGLKADIDKFVAAQASEYKAVAELLGAGTGGSGGSQGNQGSGVSGAGAGDGRDSGSGGTNLMDPKQNDFIP